MLAVKHPLGNACLNSESPGSRYFRICSGPRRNQYLHRAIWESVAGRPLPKGWIVHHMFGLAHYCPESLIALEPCLHVHAEPLRCPVTGVFMSIDAYIRRYGEPPPRFVGAGGKSSLSTE